MGRRTSPVVFMGSHSVFLSFFVNSLSDPFGKLRINSTFIRVVGRTKLINLFFLGEFNFKVHQ
jgi:hypothetical protein